MSKLICLMVEMRTFVGENVNMSERKSQGAKHTKKLSFLRRTFFLERTP